MRRVALTGGIATGKSHVLDGFARRGVPVVDADRLARDVVAPGSPALARIAERFGPGVLTAQGELDRPALASRVFADAGARRDLEAIVHPEVYDRIRTWFAEVEQDGRHPFGIADIPLLFETGREGEFDRVVVAACEPDEQVRRVAARDGVTEADARRRLAAQAPIDDKRRRADFVIDTGGTSEETDRQVEQVYRALASASA